MQILHVLLEAEPRLKGDEAVEASYAPARHHLGQVTTSMCLARLDFNATVVTLVQGAGQSGRVAGDLVPSEVSHLPKVFPQVLQVNNDGKFTELAGHRD